MKRDDVQTEEEIENIKITDLREYEFTNNLMQYVIQYFCKKSEIYGAHGKNDEKPIRRFQRPLAHHGSNVHFW